MSVIKEKFIYGDAGDEYYLDIEDCPGYSFSYVKVYIKKQYKFLWIKRSKYVCINVKDSYTMSTSGDYHSLEHTLSKIFEDYNPKDEPVYTKGWDRTFGVSADKKKQLLRDKEIKDILE